MRKLVAVAVLLGLVLALSLASAQEVNPVHYTVSGMSFQGPTELPAGLTRFTVENQEDQGVTLAVVRLSGGRSLEEFFGAMEEVVMGVRPSFPDWANFHGGVSASPGQTGSFTVFLQPGAHYLFMPGADAEGPFAARGLLLPVSVAAADVPATVTVTLQDYEFVVDGEFVAGPQTVRIVNDANQTHEMLILALPPGMSAEEVLHAPPPEGVPPGPRPTPGLWPLAPGTSAFLDIALEPGRYALFCVIPDQDGPHFTQGMIHEFEVR